MNLARKESALLGQRPGSIVQNKKVMRIVHILIHTEVKKEVVCTLQQCYELIDKVHILLLHPTKVVIILNQSIYHFMCQCRSQRGFRGFCGTHRFLKSMKWNPRILRVRRYKVLTFEATLLVKLVRVTFWNPRIEISNHAPVRLCLCPAF